MHTEIIKEVFADEAFVKSLIKLETTAEMQAALKEKGVELGEKEILAVRELISKVESGAISKEQLDKDGELSEEALEQVAGGLSWSDILGLLFGSLLQN